jgi:membrane-associated protease RseP (regulator of RpoE activity)
VLLRTNLAEPGDTSTDASSEGSVAKPDQPEKSVIFSWGIVQLRTKKLLSLLDRLARYRIFKDLGWVMIGITIAAGAFLVWLMVDQTYIILTASLNLRCLIGAAPATVCHAHNYTTTPPPPLTSVLLLPGINPYIPLLYGLVGIIVAVVIHEGMHGVIARSLKMPVKSTGLLFLLFVPIGAFVEIDEKVIQENKFRNSGRVMAGGPGSNVIVGGVALVLLLLLVGGLVPAQFNGVYIAQIVGPSPALNLANAGQLHAGDLIVGMNSTPIHTTQNLQQYLAATKPNQTVTLVILHNGAIINDTIRLGANPSNTSIGFIGISEVSSAGLNHTKSAYANAVFSDPLLFLIVPGISSAADSVVPFSNALHTLYTSPVLGAAWYPVSLTLFWIFFININLAFFNAIPLYPLDGGQALLNFLNHIGKKGIEAKAKLITGICSVLMLALILTFLFLPRLLALLPAT